MLERTTILRKIARETEKLTRWQNEVYTSLHNLQVDIRNIDASWVTRGRFGKERLYWSMDKLLLGQGPDADPIEIDPVFQSAPNSWNIGHDFVLDFASGGGTKNWDFTQLMPNDENDELILVSFGAPSVAGANVAFAEATLKYGIRLEIIIGGTTVYPPVYHPLCPLKVPTGNYSFISTTGAPIGIIRLSNKAKVNKAMDASVLLGTAKWIQGRLGDNWYDSYSVSGGYTFDRAKIDLGSVLNISKLAVRLGTWVTTTGYNDYVRLYYSTDDVTYTLFADYTNNPTSETIRYATVSNIVARYVKIRMYAYTGVTVYCNVYKILVWV